MIDNFLTDGEKTGVIRYVIIQKDDDNTMDKAHEQRRSLYLASEEES